MNIGLYFISLLPAFVYIFIITHIWTTWSEIEEWTTIDSFQPDKKITVIIPFRNERNTIVECVSSIMKCNFPKNLLEIIAVNDHSDDDGDKVLGQFFSEKVKVVSLGNEAGKKAAISKGVSVATGDLVVTTDADCLAKKEWLRDIASYQHHLKKRLIVGMVELEGRENTLESFQVMDTCGVMGLHAAGIHNRTHYLANGANLIFEKSLFLEHNPFEDNKYASGDDVFFVHKVAAQDPETIGFLKSANSTVKTEPERTWRALWHQRRRWATKNSAFSAGLYKWMTGVIWLLSLSILLNTFLIPFTGGFSFFIALTLLLIKGMMDYLYLHNMCKYFGKKSVLKYFIPVLLVQTIYIFIAGIFAITGGRYEWKGRRLHIL